MRLLSALERRPQAVLAALVALNWLAALFVAGIAEHQGWLYGWRRFQGGDDLYYHSSAWLLGTGSLPPAQIGYLWPAILAPISGLAGPLVTDAAPAAVVLQVAVLLPVALLCIYSIATRIAGRLFGYWAAALWIVLPLAAIPLFDPRYHDHYVDQLLPHVYGLMVQGDFPSLIAVLASAAFLLRALDNRSLLEVGAAGVLAGLAAGVKPANLLFLPAPFLALALARRWRELIPFGLAVLPGVLILALWKERGLGYLPAFALPELRLALDALPALGVDRLTDPLGRYIKLDWGKLQANEDLLREYFWSVRLLEWAPLAGIIAIVRRSVPAAAMLAVWLGSYVLFKGTSSSATVYYSGTFFRLLLPALPAFVLLVAAIPLLVPHASRRFSLVSERAAALSARARWAVAVAGVVLVVVPAVVIALLPQSKPRQLVTWSAENVVVPVDQTLRLRVNVPGPRPRLTWDGRDLRPTDLRYRIFRSPRTRDCLAPVERSCVLVAEPEGTTREPDWTVQGPPGRWRYRLAIEVPWTDEPERGGLILIGPPLVVDVRA